MRFPLGTLTEGLGFKPAQVSTQFASCSYEVTGDRISPEELWQGA